MPLVPSNADIEKYKSRYLLILAIVAGVFILFSGRLYCLQVSHGQEYQTLSKNNIVEEQRQVALRGMIFDRNHSLLADNQAIFELYFTPAYCSQESFETTLTRLTEYVGLTDIEIENTQEYYFNTKGLDRLKPLRVRKDMSWTELAAVEQNLSKLEGVEVRNRNRRAWTDLPGTVRRSPERRRVSGRSNRSFYAEAG